MLFQPLPDTNTLPLGVRGLQGMYEGFFSGCLWKGEGDWQKKAQQAPKWPRGAGPWALKATACSHACALCCNTAWCGFDLIGNLKTVCPAFFTITNKESSFLFLIPGEWTTSIIKALKALLTLFMYSALFSASGMLCHFIRNIFDILRGIDFMRLNYSCITGQKSSTSKPLQEKEKPFSMCSCK